jgi:hypothetical protein
MMRNLKALGAVLAAALAIGAVTASAAMATDDFAVGGSGERALTATQIDHEGGNFYEFTSTGAATECDEIHYKSEVFTEDPITEIKVHPIFEGCDALGTFAAAVTTEGCDFTLTNATEGEHLKADVTCEEGSVIVIHIPAINCEITVLDNHEHEPTGGVVYTNEGGSPNTVIGTATVEGITYVRHGDGFFCQLAASAEGEDADFVSQFTVSAYEVSDVEGNLTAGTTTFTEDSQVDLEYTTE